MALIQDLIVRPAKTSVFVDPKDLCIREMLLKPAGRSIYATHCRRRTNFRSRIGLSANSHNAARQIPQAVVGNKADDHLRHAVNSPTDNFRANNRGNWESAKSPDPAMT